jgi:ribonuclease P protein component
VPPTTLRDDRQASAPGSRHFGPDRRLRRPAEFAAVLAATRSHSLRAARLWLSMTAAWSASPTPAVRFGVTVGKRNAKRSIDRALVKRVVREAGRHGAAALESICAERKLRLDVAFRLKARRDAKTNTKTKTKTKTTTSEIPLTAWRRALREEADAMLVRLARHLETVPEALPSPQGS